MPSWIKYLSGERTIEFVSPMPLERCVLLLEDEESSASLFYAKTDVELIKLDQDTFQFYVSQSYPGRVGYLLRASGYLRRVDNRAETRIVGYVHPDWFSLAILPILVLLPVMISPPSIRVFMGLIFLMVWLWETSWPGNLEKFLKVRLLSNRI